MILYFKKHYALRMSDVVMYAVVSQFSCDSPCRISILIFGRTSPISYLLFTFIFFHPHNFNFFYPNTKFEKKNQLKYLKFLNFKFSYPKSLKSHVNDDLGLDLFYTCIIIKLLFM
ncbi:hypothetical protein JHK82_047409 [Glycine max]|uniref:Uncharacterized protein n=1 Tax=Glycine max TaxID=3847 RepID=A0A0R0FLI1_SOYBN|nr:hypothetical protein JHK86_047305 [Glycine max]KAG4943239.1 hypothetical protein JHK85_047885 [Glycine max]KAG5097555.1 hypothetical protein JHK82_047409 [Glycine max]KAG5102346.1 hypothetical protein JHK84_047315 [Glycine max]